MAEMLSHRLYGQKGYADGGKVESKDASLTRKEAIKELRKIQAEDAKNGEVDVDEEADKVRAAQPKWTDHLSDGRPGSKDWDPTMNKDPGEASQDANEVRAIGKGPAEIGLARGGKITQTAGKPVGKDDGMIPAQRGEYVIRKSAVKKLGDKVMDAVNHGHLPHSSKLYGRRAAVHG